jgi:hypothetical protein
MTPTQNNSTPAPSEGAMKAAREIGELMIGPERRRMTEAMVAAIIDRHTSAPALLEAQMKFLSDQSWSWTIKLGTTSTGIRWITGEFGHFHGETLEAAIDAALCAQSKDGGR